MKKKHFVVLAKERNTIFYAQKTLCCLGKRKKHCFLYTRNTLLSQKKKETLFSVHKKHFVFLAEERNTVSYAQETLCFLSKGNKHCSLSLLLRQQSVSYAQKTVFLSFLSFAKTTKCFLYIENSVSFFCQDNKLFLLHRGQHFFLMPRNQSVFCAQKIVFLSFAKTTKCFLYIGNSVSFFC